MDRPQRKRNRLKDYDYGQAGAYFITICVKERQKLLGDIVGADAHIGPHIELSEWGQIADAFIRNMVGVDKYCVMPNHIHLLLRSDGAGPPIPQGVQSFKILVSKACGFSIFQRSYHDHIIRGERDYQEIWRYIEENPRKWQLDRFFVD